MMYDYDIVELDSYFIVDILVNFDGWDVNKHICLYSLLIYGETNSIFKSLI